MLRLFFPFGGSACIKFSSGKEQHKLYVGLRNVLSTTLPANVF